MYKKPIRKPPPFWIGRNVGQLIPKILTIANPVLVESGLPDFPGKLRPYLMRKAALDALGATLNCLSHRRGQQNMQVFRHDGKAMQQEAPLISIVE